MKFMESPSNVADGICDVLNSNYLCCLCSQTNHINVTQDVLALLFAPIIEFDQIPAFSAGIH